VRSIVRMCGGGCAHRRCTATVAKSLKWGAYLEKYAMGPHNRRKPRDRIVRATNGKIVPRENNLK
jgi:hypothetical protein